MGLEQLVDRLDIISEFPANAFRRTITVDDREIHYRKAIHNFEDGGMLQMVFGLIGPNNEDSLIEIRAKIQYDHEAWIDWEACNQRWYLLPDLLYLRMKEHGPIAKLSEITKDQEFDYGKICFDTIMQNFGHVYLHRKYHGNLTTFTYDQGLERYLLTTREKKKLHLVKG